jgi:hypothetical protein
MSHSIFITDTLVVKFSFVVVLAAQVVNVRMLFCNTLI